MVCMFVLDLVAWAVVDTKYMTRNKEPKDSLMPASMTFWYFHCISKVRMGCDTSFVSGDIYLQYISAF